jgi:glycosyltransferase involved in cell wall biosynthesis
LVVDVILVARNQAATLSATLAEIPMRLVRSVVVVDNGSDDSTASVARDAGVVVLREPRMGHGAACLRAIAHLETLPRPPDVVVFLAADGSSDAAEIAHLLEPIRADNAELVIGVRARQSRQGGPDQSLEPRLVLGLIGAIYRHRFEDLGPFRAIRFPALIALALSDRGSAFHIEMQVKALTLGLHIAEVPVSVRPVAQDSRPRVVRRMARTVDTAGRSLFHILRHATMR